MGLNWQDAKGKMLTQEAQYGGFLYQVFWGPYDEIWYGRIMQNGKEIDRQFGRKYDNKECFDFCEKHARKQRSLLARIKRYLLKETP